MLLNACYSAVQAGAIRKIVPYVIGMSSATGDQPAIKFCQGFYRALAVGRDVPDAFRLGLVEISIYNLPDATVPLQL